MRLALQLARRLSDVYIYVGSTRLNQLRQLQQRTHGFGCISPLSRWLYPYPL
jgi:hypothetical protein